MSKPAKIFSLSVNTDGKPHRHRRQTREQSELAATDKQWEPRKNEFKGKRWAECPPEMTSQFVLAMARDLVYEYDVSGAMQMATLMAGSIMYNKSPDVLDLRLTARASGHGPACIDLMMLDVPEQSEDDNDLGVDIVAEVDTDQIDVSAGGHDAQSLLDKIFEKDPNEMPRTPFDPLSPGAMTDSDVARIVADVENKLGGKDLDILIVSSLILLAWKQAESNNANSVQLSIRGATNADKAVYPGRKMVMQASVTLYDADLRAAREQDDSPRVKASFAIKKPRKP